MNCQGQSRRGFPTVESESEQALQIGVVVHAERRAQGVRGGAVVIGGCRVTATVGPHLYSMWK